MCHPMLLQPQYKSKAAGVLSNMEAIAWPTFHLLLCWATGEREPKQPRTTSWQVALPWGLQPDFSKHLNMPRLAAIIGSLLNNCLQQYAICSVLYQLFFVCVPLSQCVSIYPPYLTVIPMNHLLQWWLSSKNLLQQRNYSTFCNG